MQLEAEGVPAVVLITEPFWTICRAFAPTIGAPGYDSIVSLPHPVSSRDDAELAVLAESIADRVARLLTEG